MKFYLKVIILAFSWSVGFSLFMFLYWLSGNEFIRSMDMAFWTFGSIMIGVVCALFSSIGILSYENISE